uniref:Integrase catalytic domain-containing protein n=1 Tax=Globodera rostochiensis TaxID=31243 RepID=A0A914HND9_GLORO
MQVPTPEEQTVSIIAYSGAQSYYPTSWISLEPEDREVTKFLWLKDINKPPSPENLKIFRFCRVAFGVISSPFILAATLQHHLKSYDSATAKELAESLYVDNALLGTMLKGEGLLQLHAFADASKHTFATAIYLRVETTDKVQSWLIFSKNRLKPKNASKALTIPRMELLAILIGSHLWSDSQIALSWVASKETHPQFIERRLKEIRGKADCTFHFVRTAENPADIATRGAIPEELHQNLLWWEGPPWLSKPETQWPDELSFEWKLCPANIQNRRKAVARISREGSFTAEDVLLAEQLVIRMDQMDDAENLQKFPSSIDEEGILRLKTRVERSDQPYGFAHPILLSKHSAILKLIILKCHQRRHHLGVDTTLTEFLSEHWAPQARSAVKRVLKECRRCRRINAYPLALPTMPQLPKERVRRHAPFQSIGIDFLGPTEVRLAGEKVKSWIILITCLATRAVYLEAMLDTTAESLLNVFRRFISRRGKPEIIWSDNATSFKLAEKTLELLSTPGPGQEVEEFLALSKIRWKFIAQISPWAGGFYERLVQVCKNCFKRTLGRKILGYDEMNSFVAEVEATLNHRPITSISDADDGPQPLRPVDFLQPEVQIDWPTTTSEINVPERGASTQQRLAARFQTLREAHNSFWEKWYSSYLLLLRERSKWEHKGPRLQTREEPKEGMIVLIAEDFVPRNQWSMGKIIELHGQPGAIRSVKVEIPVRGSEKRRFRDLPRRTVLTRPVSRIIPLEVSPEIELLEEDPPPVLEVEEMAEPAEVSSSQTTAQEYQALTKGRVWAKDPPSKAVEDTPQPREESFRAFTKGKLWANVPPIPLIIMALTMIGTLSSLAYPMDHCEECGLSCSPRGVALLVPPEVKKIELCCAEQCYIHKNVRKLIYDLPVEVLVNSYQCQGHFWVDSKHMFKKEISCPPVNECVLIDCTLCVEQLANPTCNPLIASMLAGGLCLSLLSMGLLILSSLKILFSAVRMVIWLITQLFTPIINFVFQNQVSHSREDTERRPFFRRSRNSTRNSASQNWTSRRIFRSAAFVVILGEFLLPLVQGGAETVAIMAQSNSCLKTATDLKCTVENTATLALLPAGQTNTLLLKTEEGIALGLGYGLTLSDCCPTRGARKWVLALEPIAAKSSLIPGYRSYGMRTSIPAILFVWIAQPFGATNASWREVLASFTVEMGEFPIEDLENWLEPTEERLDPSPDQRGGLEERTPSPVGQNWNPPPHVWPLNEREPLNEWFTRVCGPQWSLTSVIKEKTMKL